MGSRSHWYGYEIEKIDGEWLFVDTGEPTVGSDRPCGRCHDRHTAEGHDACLGTLPGVRNACCGHGQAAEAYVQMLDGKVVRGPPALGLMQRGEHGQ